MRNSQGVQRFVGFISRWCFPDADWLVSKSLYSHFFVVQRIRGVSKLAHLASNFAGIKWVIVALCFSSRVCVVRIFPGLCSIKQIYEYTMEKSMIIMIIMCPAVTIWNSLSESIQLSSSLLQFNHKKLAGSGNEIGIP